MPNLSESYGIITGTASLVGLALAFWQLHRVRTTAEAASETATRVEGQLQQRSALSEMTACGQAVSDARTYIRLGHVQIALYRIELLASRLSSIRKLEWFLDKERAEALAVARRNVALVRTGLDQSVCEKDCALSPDDARMLMGRLSKVEDQVNEWVGELRYFQEARRS